MEMTAKAIEERLELVKKMQAYLFEVAKQSQRDVANDTAGRGNLYETHDVPNNTRPRLDPCAESQGKSALLSSMQACRGKTARNDAQQ